MGVLRNMVLGRPVERAAVPLGETIRDTVPFQHAGAEGVGPYQNLPIVRKCLQYTADTINETEARIVDASGRVLAAGPALPAWIRQPSGEFVFSEFVHQAVWSLYWDGILRVLASQRPNRPPSSMYVGTRGLLVHTQGPEGTTYIDTVSGYGGEFEIVANKVAFRRRMALPGGFNRPVSECDSARRLFEVALNAQDALDRFFGSNMFLDIVVSSMDKEGGSVNSARDLIAQLARRHSGPSRAFRPIVTDGMWKIDRIRDSNQANQLVELIGLVNSYICSQVFGIDPHVFSLSQSQPTSLTYQNAANLRSQVWLQAVAPIARQIAGCVSDFLPRGQRLEFDASGMLQGSPSDRASLVSKMALAQTYLQRLGVVFTPDEMRHVVGMQPLTDEQKEMASMDRVEIGEIEAQAAAAQAAAMAAEQ